MIHNDVHTSSVAVIHVYRKHSDHTHHYCPMQTSSLFLPCLFSPSPSSLGVCICPGKIGASAVCHWLWYPFLTQNRKTCIVLPHSLVSTVFLIPLLLCFLSIWKMTYFSFLLIIHFFFKFRSDSVLDTAYIWCLNYIGNFQWQIDFSCKAGIHWQFNSKRVYCSSMMP